MRLDDTLKLHTADRYLHPLNGADKLPVAFGDHQSVLTRGGETDVGGCLPTVLIDQLNLVFLMSDSVIGPGPIEIYARQNQPIPTLQNPSTYTIYRGINYEGQGPVTVVQFSLSWVAGSDVTWRGPGSVDAAGVAITDPVTMLYLMFTVRGNWVSEDFDPQMLARAQGIAATYGFPLHWCFTDDAAYGQILADVCQNYLAEVSLTSNGQLGITYNLWPFVPIAQNDVIEPYLDAAMDAPGDDPEDEVSYTLSRENLVNEVIIRWRHNWATDTQAAEYDFVYAPSQNAYQVRKAEPFTLKGIRTMNHLYTWIQLFLSPLVEMPAFITMPCKALLPYMQIQRGTYVALNLAHGPDPLGRGWIKRILRVIETTTDHLAQIHTFTAIDTRLSVVPPQAVPFLDAVGATWYLRIRALDGQLEFVSSLAFPWIAVGTPRRYVIRMSPQAVPVYINPSTSGAILSSLSSPGGFGNALSVDLIDLTFREWDIEVQGGTFAVIPRARNLGVKPIAVP